MEKESIIMDGIKYELHDKAAVEGDTIIITYKQPISEDMFEIGDIFVADVVYHYGTVAVDCVDGIKVVGRDEYKVLHPVSSENEPDETTESDTPIMDVLAKISRSICALNGRIYVLEADIKDIRENLTEELYESHSEISELSRDIADVRNLSRTDFDFLGRIQDELYGKIQGVHDYTLDLTETIEMHTDDIVMLDERTQDLLISNNVKGEDDLISVEELKSAIEWINRSSRK